MVLEQLDSHVYKKEISIQSPTLMIYFQSYAYLKRVVTIVVHQLYLEYPKALLLKVWSAKIKIKKNLKQKFFFNK